MFIRVKGKIVVKVKERCQAGYESWEFGFEQVEVMEKMVYGWIPMMILIELANHIRRLDEDED